MVYVEYMLSIHSVSYGVGLSLVYVVRLRYVVYVNKCTWYMFDMHGVRSILLYDVCSAYVVYVEYIWWMGNAWEKFATVV